MHVVVIEHVSPSDLPAAWRSRLPISSDARLTIRIEEEAAEPMAQTADTSNPLFGMWQDREAVADVAAHMQVLRDSRYDVDASRRGG